MARGCGVNGCKQLTLFELLANKIVDLVRTEQGAELRFEVEQPERAHTERMGGFRDAAIGARGRALR